MPPGIYRLPLELVREVAAECSSRDLAALALSARHFHAWVNPCLYEHNIRHEEADAAVWAATRGRLDTLLLVHQANTRSSEAFITKFWCESDRYDALLPLEFPPSRVKFTLLHLAAQGGHDDVLSWLLQQGADVDAYAKGLCECGHQHQTDSSSWTALHLAICHCQENTVKLLLAHNASLQTGKPEKIEALHNAAAEGLTSTILHLSTLPGFNANVKDWKRRTPLHHAIKAPRNLNAVKTLLDVGADVLGACGDGSRYPYTPLWNAFAQGNLEMAAILLQAGAKPFPCNDKGRKRFKQQLRALQRALHVSLLKATVQEKSTTSHSSSTRHGVLQRKVIRALLDFGCDIKHDPMSCFGSPTALIMAVRKSSSATVRLLLERGAEINAKYIGRSALWYALFEPASPSLTERVDKVTALLEHDADLLDQQVIGGLITLRNARAVVNAVADTLGPENLTGLHTIPRVLGLCRLFQEPRLYDSIKRYAQTQARATDDDIRYALEEAASTKRTCVPTSLDELRPILDEMRPGLTVDGLLDQWRDGMSFYLVRWLEEIRGLESSE